MAVESTATTTGPLPADGSATVFDFTFKAASADEVGALAYDDDGAEVSLPGFTVTLSDSGGSVTFDTAPATSSLYLYSNPDFRQQIEFEQGSRWLASPVNEANDRAALRDLWLRDRVDLIAPDAMVSPEGRAGKFLAWDADGNPVTSAGTGADTGLRTDLAAAAGTGASLVSFRPSGSGAVTRSEGAKLSDTVSVKDFGATGDGVTADLTAFTNAATSLTTGGAIDIPAGAYKVGAQSLYPARGNVQAFDTASIGTTDILTNGTFTGSPATGWTLANFTSTAPGLSHTAGTQASAKRTITVADGQRYMIRVWLTTTTAGTGTLFINGQALLGATDFFGLPVDAEYAYDFWYTPLGTSGAIDLEFRSNVEWAGSIRKIEALAMARELPSSFFSISSDKKDFSYTYSLKFGRYLAGNIALGDRSTLSSISATASWNVAVGARALTVLTDGIESTALGSFAGEFYQGSQGTFVGYAAGRGSKKGFGVVFVGFKAGGLSNGDRVTITGYLAGLQNNNGNDILLAGYQAGYACKGSSLTVLGSQAGQQLNGGDGNTYVGANSGPFSPSPSNLFSYSFQTLAGAGSYGYGDNVISIGYDAHAGSDSYTGGAAITTSAIAIGVSSRSNANDTIVIGGNATVPTATSIGSTIVGNGAQGLGEQSTALGYLTEARMFDVAIGSQAGRSLTGTQNTSLGVSANNFSGGAQAYTNTTSLGFNALATGSNQVTLGNASVVAIRAAVTTITAISDKRDKKKITPITGEFASAFVQSLSPARWEWSMRGEFKRTGGDVGFIAQDLQAAQVDHDAAWLGLVNDNDPDRLEATPGRLIPVLVAALKDALARIEALEGAA